MRYERGGTKHAVRLDVRVEGAPPVSRKLADKGDASFERSRARAELRASQVLKEITAGQSDEELLKRIHAIRTGKAMRAVLLVDIPVKWRGLRRKKPLSDSYVDQCESKFLGFESFIKDKDPSATQMADIGPDLAEAYLEHVEAKGVTPKTYNDHLILLRSTFEALKRAASMSTNPFDDIPTKTVDTEGRVPFSPEELAMIVEVARRPEHAFILPIILTGICSAMRRGDCCTLQWADVDLAGEVIKVKTAKTGETATIPLFPLLRAQLEKAEHNGPDVFPEQATMYRSNPDGITWRVQQVLKAAGFFDSPNPGKDGHRGNCHVTRKTGLRRASVRDFHAFRITWVTLALTAGVPEELVRKVTGHTTVNVVRKSYFKPTLEALRDALISKTMSLTRIDPPLLS